MSLWATKTLVEFVTLQRGHDLTERDRRSGLVPVMGSAGQNETNDKSRANPSELAFYEPLADNASAVADLGDPVRKTIAQELTHKLRGSATVDWQRRESVRARLRNLVRITLRRHKYPPDLQDGAIRLVMEQAERLADEWTL